MTALIEAGVDRNAQRRRVRPALSALSFLPARLLLEWCMRRSALDATFRSIPTRARSQDGKTALHLAFASDDSFVTDAANRLLLKHGAEVALTDNVRVHYPLLPALLRSLQMHSETSDASERASKRASVRASVQKRALARAVLRTNAGHRDRHRLPPSSRPFRCSALPIQLGRTVLHHIVSEKGVTIMAIFREEEYLPSAVLKKKDKVNAPLAVCTRSHPHLPTATHGHPLLEHPSPLLIPAPCPLLNPAIKEGLDRPPRGGQSSERGRRPLFPSLPLDGHGGPGQGALSPAETASHLRFSGHIAHSETGHR